MKCLVFLSLFAVAFAVTQHSLSEITNAATAQVVVTSQFPDAKVAPVLVTLISATTSYDSSVPLVILTFSGTVTSTGNNTAVAVVFTFSNGGSDVQTIAAGVVGGAFTSSNYYTFRTSGTYTVSSASIYTSLRLVYNNVALPATGLPSITVTKYPGATLSAVTVTSPQAGGCDNTGCTNPGNFDANATITAGKVGQSVALLFRNPAPASAAYVIGSIGATGTTGKATFTGNTGVELVVGVGGVVNGQFSTQFAYLPASSLLPKSAALPVSAIVTEDLTQVASKTNYISEGTVGGFQTAVTFSVGTTDVTAPTCTSVSITPATINTFGQGNGFQSFTTALTCADENGGSGLYTSGVFGTVTSGSSTASVTLSLQAATVVPNYVSGSVVVTGVYAIDNAGNVALYGACGTNVFAGVCNGGGSSSSSTVAASLLLIAALVLALLA